MSERKIAAQLNTSRGAVRHHREIIRREGVLGPEAISRLEKSGIKGDAIIAVHSGWLKNQPDDAGESESIHFMLGKAPEDAARLFEELATEALDRIKEGAFKYPQLDRGPVQGNNLLVVDPADVHIGKLCVKSEVGVTYNSEIAVKRMVHGARALVRKALPHGISRIVLVLGNDIMHADTWHGATTAGTKQDVDGLWHQWFTDARDAYVQLIQELAEVADVHLVYCPSNHDWQTGFYLAQTIAAWFHNHPQVHCPAYYMSPIHRKYFVYEQGLLGFTHGDGAKESDLPNLMQLEAREFWSATKHAYWYTHHLHHKRRLRVGLTREMLEEDKTGVTIIASSTPPEIGSTTIELVRSPSAPDGWHHRNGYVNAQAVECFLHGPDGGQFARFTEYF